MGRVLVIDGDAARRVALATALGAEGHDVEMASAAATGAQLARVSRPDLVIVESILSDGSGAEVLTLLRRDPSTARQLVVVIGPSGDEIDRVVAFEHGADDYVTRPFSLRELLLRVRALLRRTRSSTPPDTIALGPVHIDRGTRRVTVNGAPVSLTRRELDLLLRLFDSRGRVLARETIVADVWREDAASERVVDTTLKRLRRKLPVLSRQIRTIRGIGYELTADEVVSG